MAYGYGTRSWMHSTEFHHMKKDIAQTTARYLEQPHAETEVAPLCNCDTVSHSHDPLYHHNQQWPLVWSKRP